MSKDFEDFLFFVGFFFKFLWNWEALFREFLVFPPSRAKRSFLSLFVFFCFSFDFPVCFVSPPELALSSELERKVFIFILKLKKGKTKVIICLRISRKFIQGR